MTTAVLETRAKVPIGNRDVYLSTVGGMRLTDPSSDLAVALAVTSSVLDLCLPSSVVAIGEVGLAGDLRRVTGMERRLAEAARLGFSTALIAPGVKSTPAGMKVIEVATVGDALRTLLDIAAAPASKPPEVKAASRTELKLVDQHPKSADYGDNG